MRFQSHCGCHAGAAVAAGFPHWEQRLCLLVWGGFFKGFLFEPVFCGNQFPLCNLFFFPPELFSAPCTGLKVNNILPIQKKR